MHMLTIFMLQDIGGGGRPLFFHEVTNRPFPLSNVFTQSWNFNFSPYPAFYNFKGDWHGWGGDLLQRISWCRQSHWVQVFDFQIFITINIIIVIAMITIKHSHKPNHHSIKARFEGGSMHNNHHDHLQVRLEDGAMYPKQRLQLLRRNLRSGKSYETQSCLSMVEQFCNIGEIAQLLILKLLSESFLKITTIWLLPVFLVRISVDCNPGNILYCSSSEFSGNQPLLSDCWFWQSCFWLNVYFYFPTNLEGAQSPLAMNLL